MTFIAARACLWSPEFSTCRSTVSGARPLASPAVTHPQPLVVSTVNVNGVRAAARKGLLAWLDGSDADVVCLQETRADDAQLAAALAPVVADGWHLSAATSSVVGRSGVAVLTRVPPAAVRTGFGAAEFADAGRYLEVDVPSVDGPVTVASLYLPSGDAGTPKQAEKERFMAGFGRYLASTTDGRRVVCGDVNIARAPADLKNWKANQRSSGFLPQERQWLEEVLACGWVDVARALDPTGPGPYTWWSYRGRAFDNDAGWRIDLQLATVGLAAQARSAVVERASEHVLRWSDHAPLTVRYEGGDRR